MARGASQTLAPCVCSAAAEWIYAAAQAPQAEVGEGECEGEALRECRLQLLMYRKDRRSREGRQREASAPPALELSALNEDALESIQVRAVRAVCCALAAACRALQGRVALGGTVLWMLCVLGVAWCIPGQPCFKSSARPCSPVQTQSRSRRCYS